MAGKQRYIVVAQAFKTSLSGKSSLNFHVDFYFRIDSPLARLYSTSTMEHHHFDHCTMILHSQASFKKDISVRTCGVRVLPCGYFS